MWRQYLGLLLCGSSFSAIAGEMDRGMPAYTFNPSTIQDARPVPDSTSSCRCGESVVFTGKAVIAPVPSFLGSASQPFPVAEQNEDTIHGITGRHEGIGSRLGTLLRLKRIDFNGERFKITLRSEAASMEAGHLKVSLQSGLTSIMWSQAL